MNEVYSPSLEKRWQRGDGWRGIVPGRTAIKDAIQKLGGTCEVSEMINGFSFDFRQGLIRVTTIEQHGIVSKLWMSGDLAQEKIIPETLNDAETVFQNLRWVRHDVGTEIYESDGVRLAAQAGSENGRIAWIELF
ncbi:MAG: hypothetical protein IT343_08885 [Candidatus Melainabacteria bacterium]|jgi:hypothetical protein|nr:hypothetical protein [Candidatus Melainabacteria bacterium]